MKKIASILKNKEIMNRILFTILILFVFRIGAQITVPGVTLGSNITNYLNSSYALSLMNLLGGGTLQSFSIFALGVSPYITAQIIVELLSSDVLPALAELKRQGQSGRKKMDLATRYLTLMLGAVQAYGIIKTMENSEAITFVTADQEWLTYIYIIVIMMAGSMIVMWLGDQISVKGIGNGISMIIFAGIVCSLPSQIGNAFSLWVGNSALQGQGDSARIAGIFKFLLYILAYVPTMMPLLRMAVSHLRGVTFAVHHILRRLKCGRNVFPRIFREVIPNIILPLVTTKAFPLRWSWQT